MKKRISRDIFDESDFPISQVRRNVLSGTGADIEEYQDKPLIAVANSATEMNPGHMHLGGLAARVKDGINAGGGIPFEFNVPAPCDALAEGNEGMRYVLPQRELIADTVETHIRSMRFDAVVMIASCDKIIPGMAAAGAQVMIFTTGRGNPIGFPMVPVIKVISSTQAYQRLEDDMDANAGVVYPSRPLARVID